VNIPSFFAPSRLPERPWRSVFSVAQFATYDELRRLGAETRAEILLEKAHARTGKTVFLSHSTADDDLVAGVTLILENHGGKVYVDHKDPSLPGEDLIAIGEHLRTIVRGCGKLVLLASPRSKDSKWIPWELGLGDGMHHEGNVALFPSAESSYDITWSEREYLSLYRRIVWGLLEERGVEEYCWFLWDYRKNTGLRLKNWLS
jgi:hypothetical protein